MVRDVEMLPYGALPIRDGLRISFTAKRSA